MKTVLPNDRGLALAIVLVMMVILLAVTGAGLFQSGLNLKASGNLKGGTAALQAADAGIHHAVGLIPGGGDFDSFWAGTGLTNFPCKNSSGSTGTCNGTTYKPTLTGSINGYTYTVVVENDVTVSGELATNDTNKIVILTSTATGSTGSTRKVRAYIGRSPWIPPGTIYIPGTPTNAPTVFNGNTFAVTGNDTNPNGTAGPLAAISAVATNNAAETTAISGAGGTLSSGQYGQVTGQGSNPSVATSTNFDVNQLANDLIALGGADLQTYGGGTFRASDGDVGTSSNPKITHITGNARLTCGNGHTANAIGYGVLIVDGDLDIQGNFQFQGLIIARGEDQTLNGAGAKVSGALLIKESTTSGGGLTVGGNSNLRYSSLALNNYVLSRWANAFSTNAKIIAWHELML